jgi:hypothetical protein
MLTSFVLSMALAAPVPPPAPPVASGPAPRLLELKPDASGKIMVAVVRMEKIQIGQGGAVLPGGAAPAVITREIARTSMVELSQVKDLTVTTADGKKLEVADALKQLDKGGTVIVSADGKPVSPNFLKLFKDDVLILASPELTGGQTGVIGKPLPGGGIRPVPPIQIQPLPGQIQPLPAPVAPGGVIQIQIQGGQVEVVPLPAPVPALPEKK